MVNQPVVAKLQVARELGVNANACALDPGAERGRRAGVPRPGQGQSRDQELVALERELALVKRERDFLEEAAAFFAKQSN